MALSHTPKGFRPVSDAMHATVDRSDGDDDDDDRYAVDTNDHCFSDNDNMQNCGQLFCAAERACVMCRTKLYWFGWSVLVRSQEVPKGRSG